VTDNIIPLGKFIQIADRSIEKILEDAKGELVEELVILGWDKNSELYFATTGRSGADVLWLLEAAKYALLDR